MKLSANTQQTRRIAHDLLSPLASLSLLLNQENHFGEEERLIANQALHRMQLLVEQLIECPEASRNPTPSKPIAIAPLLKAVVREQVIALGATPKKTLKLNLPDLRFTVRCRVQPLVFECVISNLIGNAIAAANEKPLEVWVSLTCHGPRAVVTVTDNGPGIPEVVLKYYEKGVPYSTKKGGHGLGLLSARSIALGWKGCLRISTQKHGTSIILELPLTNKEGNQ
ncbi:MAG: hypothetical protein KDD51_05085 [Bdellovibrionales bacterium]|nr:hypothetical protein [Bdellovibrionales bacterium]